MGRILQRGGLRGLIKSILTAKSIFHLTPLNIPPGCFATMNKVERTFLWASTILVMSTVKWEAVCRPTHLGGLGILHLEKLARDLFCGGLGLSGVTPTSFALV
jgi:hypothetical protein